MSGVSDSKATFESKAKAYGLTTDQVADFSAKGIETYSQLLFRVAPAPNQVDGSKVTALVDSIRPVLNEAQKGAVTRLIFEAGTFIVSELRASLDAPSSEPSRKLTAQERSSRHFRQN